LIVSGSCNACTTKMPMQIATQVVVQNAIIARWYANFSRLTNADDQGQRLENAVNALNMLYNLGLNNQIIENMLTDVDTHTAAWHNLHIVNGVLARSDYWLVSNNEQGLPLFLRTIFENFVQANPDA